MLEPFLAFSRYAIALGTIALQDLRDAMLVASHNPIEQGIPEDEMSRTMLNEHGGNSLLAREPHAGKTESVKARVNYYPIKGDGSQPSKKISILVIPARQRKTTVEKNACR